MNELIRICIICVTRTGEALLNEPASHGRNIRHIFFEPNILCSYPRSIMQYSMHNQCSGLFTRIMDYLYVLCMILMVWICALCMTFMLFIYVYYGLFACTNLVDIMMLFLLFFLSNDRFSVKFNRFLSKFIRKSCGRFSEKVSDFLTDNSAKPAEIRDSRIQLFLRHLQCASINFY
jgi:hypothetical protein